MIVKGNEVMDRYVDEPIIFLIAERFFCAVNFHVDIFVVEIESLELLVQILLEKLFGQISGEPKA